MKLISFLLFENNFVFVICSYVIWEFTEGVIILNTRYVLKQSNKCNVKISGRPSMDILVRSCQDLGKILAKILPRYCRKLQDVMVRSYQENHVPTKNFIVKSYLDRKDLKGSQQKYTSMQIYVVRHDNFLLARYKV